MSHALDFTTGKAGIAYIGDEPWHGLGQRLTPGASLDIWQCEAGLDWEAKRAGVRFDRKIVDVGGVEMPVLTDAKEHHVLYRSDTGGVLSVVSPKYQPVQPRQIIEFYRDLTEKYGYQLETAGSLKGGRKIWALANTKNVTQLRGGDEVRGYLLLATSFDGSMSTQARFTSIRVVCNNTLTCAAESGRADVIVPHSTAFDADKVKLDLKVGDAWEAFSAQAAQMSKRIVNRDESVNFFLDVYYGLDTSEKIKEFRKDEDNDKRVEKFAARLQHALFNSPGAHMESARGMLWGLVNAVTFDVDHTLPSRNQENRLNKAWFGQGNALKQRAWDKALRMVA